MASLQAHLAVWITKWRVKRRLKGVRDYRVARKILRPDRYKVPASVRISAAALGGVPGEWLEGPKSGSIVLLYLHGGGYFGCSPETHRAITSTFALQEFRVYAPDYRLALSLMLAVRASAIPLPASAAIFSPWTDLAATGDSVRTNARRCAMFSGTDI